MTTSPLRFISIVGLLLVCLPRVIPAASVTVRQDGTGDFTTISDAVAFATAGDVIDVGPGTYVESVTINKSLTVVGTSGGAATTVDGANAFVPFVVSGLLHLDLQDLTIAHGRSPGGTAGGGVGIRGGAVATITGCHFEGNTTALSGGAVFVKGPSRADVDQCSFAGNHADGDGGAGYATEQGVLNVTECTFTGNTGGPWGAALGNYYSTLNVTGCLFAYNRSEAVAGAIYFYHADGNVTRSTFYHNTSGPAEISGTVFIHESPSASVTQCIIAGDQATHGLYLLDDVCYHACNIFWDNPLGPIAGDVLAPTEVVADPLFCAPVADNFYVALNSPAQSQNNTCGVLIGAYPVGCGPVPVRNTTWGRIKEAYRKDN